MIQFIYFWSIELKLCYQRTYKSRLIEKG